MNRGEIFWVRLDPVEGSEVGKTRPCVIVSDHLRNEALSTVVVCPLTTVVRPNWRTRLTVTSAGRKADVCADQIRTVSRSRLERRLGRLTPKQLTALQRLLSEMYGGGE